MPQSRQYQFLQEWSIEGLSDEVGSSPPTEVISMAFSSLVFLFHPTIRSTPAIDYLWNCWLLLPILDHPTPFISFGSRIIKIGGDAAKARITIF
jgi:hypothetical protein